MITSDETRTWLLNTGTCHATVVHGEREIEHIRRCGVDTNAPGADVILAPDLTDGYGVIATANLTCRCGRARNVPVCRTVREVTALAAELGAIAQRARTQPPPPEPIPTPSPQPAPSSPTPTPPRQQPVPSQPMDVQQIADRLGRHPSVSRVVTPRTSSPTPRTPAVSRRPSAPRVARPAPAADSDVKTPFHFSDWRDVPVLSFQAQKKLNPRHHAKGTCPYCGERKSMRKENTIYPHQFMNSNCPGSTEVTANLVPDQDAP